MAHPFIEELIQEHREIEKLLSEFMGLLNSSETRDTAHWIRVEEKMNTISHLVETVHHGKEEDFLFPALASSTKLGQGGPNCTLYMGLRIEYSTVRPIMELLKESPHQIQMPKHKPHIQKYIDDNTPLSIPLEEHDAGHVAVALMRAELDLLKSGSGEEKRLKKVAEKYVAMLQLHIQKEDNCLFKMAESAIDDSAFDEVLKKKP